MADASPFDSLSGWLNVRKPAGCTSRDVVNRVQRLVRPAKVGHAGTLDPLATGVLVVAVGAATRLVEYVQRMTKHYRSTFLLGRSSTTEDIEGEVTLLPDPPRPDREQLRAAAARLVGEIMQRPPAYSAVHVGGQRSYAKARRGEEFTLPARPVRVDRLELVRYDYPELELEIACGSGTYVRSLGRDLAESLGTAAVMSALERTAIGSFRADEACSPEVLSPESLRSWLLPLARGVEMLPSLIFDDADVRRLGHGQRVTAPAGAALAESAAFDRAGRLVAIVAPEAGGPWRSIRGFPLPTDAGKGS